MDTSFWAKIYVEVCHTSSNDRGSTQVFVAEVDQVRVWYIMIPLVLHSVLKQLRNSLFKFSKCDDKRIFDLVCPDVLERIKVDMAQESHSYSGTQCQ